MVKNKVEVPAPYQKIREEMWEGLIENRQRIEKMLMTGAIYRNTIMRMMTFILSEMALEQMLNDPDWENQKEECIKLAEESLPELTKLKEELKASVMDAVLTGLGKDLQNPPTPPVEC